MSEIEKKAADTLTEQGVYFETQTEGLLRLIKKSRKWYIKPSKLGTLYKCTSIYLRNELNGEKMNENPRKAANELAVSACKDYAEIIAIAILNSKWKIKLFSKILAGHFYWKLEPKDLYEIMVQIVTANDIVAFINTIKLTSGIAQIVAPKEKMSPDVQGG